jgi:signal transduction histidine kinase
LPIAQQLIQAHGGRIGVESKPGRGTVFIIDLPAGSNPAGTEEA